MYYDSDHDGRAGHNHRSVRSRMDSQTSVTEHGDGSPRRAGQSVRASTRTEGSVSRNMKTHHGKWFVDAELMKEKIRAAAIKPTYHVSNYYSTTGLWQRIARHQMFENVTLTVIAINAFWIAVDTDHNPADVLIAADPIFQVAEHLFCFYFSLEWFVRFQSFEKKRDGLRDGWFVFDSVLVFMGVSETWVMTIVLLCAGGSGGGLGSASMLKMARLLRLSRMARMARLFKVMPELLILIKAMFASIRSCSFVFFLLAIIMYVFGIAFKQLTHGTPVGDKYFKTVARSMQTLWIDGTLLDNPGRLVAAMEEENIAFVIVFYMFLVLSAMTVLNMLIGVLCEVVTALAATEKESLAVNWVKTKLQDLMDASGFDQDHDGMISKEEFSSLLEFPEACKALTDIGVDIYCLIDNIDFIFGSGDGCDDDEGDKVLSFEEFMGLILDLRGSNTATVKDMVELRKFITRSNRRVQNDLKACQDRILQRQGDLAKSILHPPKPPSYSMAQLDREDHRHPHAPSIAPQKLEYTRQRGRANLDDCESTPVIREVTQNRQNWKQDDLVKNLQDELQQLVQEAFLPQLKKMLHGDLLDGLMRLQQLEQQIPDPRAKRADPQGLDSEQSLRFGTASLSCARDRPGQSRAVSPLDLPGQLATHAEGEESAPGPPVEFGTDGVHRSVTPNGVRFHGSTVRRHKVMPFINNVEPRTSLD